jgi:predicted nuclease with TOPRIM domain
VRIETLRRQQNEVNNVKSIKHNTSEKCKDTIIEALRHKVKELEIENKKLNDENNLFLGKLYDKP